MSKENHKFETARVQFNGGYADYPDANQIAENQSPYLKNCRIDGLGIAKRPGYTSFADTITSGTGINGIAGYIANTAATRKIVMNYYAGLYYATPTSAAWTAISNTITADTEMNFVTYGEVLLCMNQTDELGLLTGTTYTEPASAAVQPLFGEIFTDQLFAGGFAGATANVIQYGRTATDANPEYLYSIGNGTNGEGSRVMDTAVKSIVRGVGDRLYVFTEEKSYYLGRDDFDLSGSTPVPIFQLYENYGAASYRSVVPADTQIFYLTPQNEIRRIGYVPNVTGIQDNVISTSIKNLMGILDEDQSGSWAMYYPQEQVVKFWVAEKDSAFNNIVLVRDLKANSWLVDSPTPFACGVIYEDKAYTGSNLEGKVFIDETGYSDEDSADISSTYYTKEDDLQSPNTWKDFSAVRIFGKLNDNTSMTATVFVDGSDVGSFTIDSNDINTTASIAGLGATGSPVALGGGGIGESIIGEGDTDDPDAYATYGDQGKGVVGEFTKIIDLWSSGKKIQLKLFNNGQGQYFNISQADIEFMPLDENANPSSDHN